jgi:hypothetical protein
MVDVGDEITYDWDHRIFGCLILGGWDDKRDMYWVPSGKLT